MVTDPSPVGRYQRREVLGTGSFATVWLAHDPVTGLDVALKVLADNWSRDQQVRDRFIREARVLLQAESPHIIRVHHVAEDDEQPYMVMAYAAGGTLRQRMTDRRRSGEGFTLEETLAIGRDLGRGIEATHALGHIHRDIKPANVLLHSSEAAERFMLGDFGLARAIDDTAVTMISGSPGYVAPEQAAGLDQLDERADLYPLGLIITELLSGSPPFVSTSMKAAASQGQISVREHIEGEGGSIPQWLEPLLDSLLHPQPAGRPESASEVAEFLDARLQGQAAVAPRRSGAPVGTEDSPRRKSKAVPAVVAVLATAGAGIWWGLAQDDEPTNSAAPAPTTQVTENSAADSSSSTISVPSALADSIPLPPNARVDQFASEGGILVVANVALSVEEVAAFYRDDPTGDWEVLAVAEAEDGASVELSNTGAGVDAIMSLSPTALSTDASITRIETRFSGS